MRTRYTQRLLPTIQRLTLPHAFAFTDTTEACDWIVTIVESLVNRHRIEAYILDAKGRIAVSFERIRWDEQEVVTRAIELLNEKEF